MSETGKELLSTLVKLSGLPEDDVRKELDKIVAQSGHSEKDLTLDELRQAMMLYLEKIDADIGHQEPSQTH